MKGFIEVFPIIWRSAPDPDNPFDGDYIKSDIPLLISVKSIMRVEREYIFTNTAISGQSPVVKASLTYEEIKYLIKQAI